MSSIEHRLLVKVAQMYYLENMNQNEIADKFGINRTTISKYLKKAMAAGIVQIQIVNNSYEGLETELEKKFGLKEVYLVPTGPDNHETKLNLGRAGLRYLNRIAADKNVVGFAWGSTMAALSNVVGQEACAAIAMEMVPLVGGPENVDSEFHVNTIIYKLAQAFKAKGHHLYAPAITGSRDIRAAIMQDVNCSKITALWQQVDIAIVGIGAPIQSSNLVWTGACGREYADVLREAGVVGDICSRFYDINGRIVETELRDRTIAIELEQLRSLKYSIGVAAAPEKVPAIYGALQGKFVNVLISDEETARRLLAFAG